VGNMCESLSCLLTSMKSSDKDNLEMGTESVARQRHHKTAKHCWVHIVKQQLVGRRDVLHSKTVTLIQPMEADQNPTTFLTDAHALLGKVFGEHTKRRNVEFKSIINQDRQVALTWMPLDRRLAVNTHNMGGHFAEKVKNARSSTSFEAHKRRGGEE